MAKKRAKGTKRRKGERQPQRRFVPNDAEILNAEAAAEVLGLSTNLLRRMARDGEVPGRKVGKEWRFHRSTLRKWIAGDSEVDQLLKAMQKHGHKVTKKKR